MNTNQFEIELEDGTCLIKNREGLLAFFKNGVKNNNITQSDVIDLLAKKVKDLKQEIRSLSGEQDHNWE